MSPSTPGFREVLRSDPAAGVDYHAEYLESDRFPIEDASLAFRDYVRRKYQGRRIDVAVAVTDVALEFALRHRSELFPDTPIVFSAVTPPGADARDAGAGVTGITTGSLIGQTLALALRLHPSTERIFVVAEAPDDNYQAAMQQTLRSFERTISLTYLSGLSVNELAAAVRRVPERSFILYVRYSLDQPGQVLLPSEVAGIVARSAAVPVYGSAESYMGSGVVGGVIWPQNSLGKRLGEMALQILTGQEAKDIPIEQPRPVPTFDWPQLRRWSIDPSRLPAGSVTLFREFSAWELYRWYIVGAIGVIALQGVMISALIVLRARRRETEERNQDILKVVPDLMFLQSSNLVYLDYHAPDRRMLFMPPEQFLGRHMRDVLPPDLVRTLEPALQRVVASQSPTVVEYALRMPDGERHYEARIVRASGLSC